MKTKEVRFAVKDKAQFDMDQVKAALQEQGFAEAELLSGPS